MKRIAILLLAGFLLLPTAFAASCGLANDDQLIFRISGTTNAHAEVYNGAGGYGTEICYNDIFSTTYDVAGEHHLCASNIVLWLSGTTNAHADSTGVYPEKVCFGDLACTARGTPGNPGSCLETEKCIARISDTTNAHLAECDDSDYDVWICCSSAATVANVPPVANAGVDQSTLSGVSVSLSGSCSDSDGTISDCDWGSAPVGCVFDAVQAKSGLGTNAAGSNVDVTCVGAGGDMFDFTLTATDNASTTGSDTATVTVALPVTVVLRITKLFADPLALVFGVENFDNLDVEVLNSGDGPVDARIRLFVLEAVTNNPAAVVPAERFQTIGPLGKDVWDADSALGLSVLPSGSYKLVVEAYEVGESVPHDAESVFFTVGQPAVVPELGVAFILLLAFSVLAILFFSDKYSGKPWQ